MKEPRFEPKKSGFRVHSLKFTIIAQTMQNESIASPLLSLSFPVHKMGVITPPAHEDITRIQEQESGKMKTIIYRVDKQQGPTV